ncbi:hypothetical protein [Bacillus sp. 2205SS5-2]|uniref:hypothetical protein n=1 Tax=Bacillus sp. 2205SS5-2 TaxID=3109031 RepID=UPI0030054BB2
MPQSLRKQPLLMKYHSFLDEKVDTKYPYFFMGDFNNNAFVRDEGYDFLLSKGLFDTYNLAENPDNGITVEGKIAGWDENKMDLRIDLVLVRDKINVKSSKVIFNAKNKPIVSDHFGVEVILG